MRFVTTLVFLLTGSWATAQQPKTYAEALGEALRRNVPVVVGSDCKPTAPAGCVTYHGSFDSGPGIVVGIPKGDKFTRIDLPAASTTAQIQAAIDAERRSRLAPVPFSQEVPAENRPGSADALDEVNAQRRARGLRPFLRDDGLTAAALACAQFRAARRIAGHTDDFKFLPQGCMAAAAGCAAWPPSMGWGSCCYLENWTYAGAAWAMGADGNRYMHLYVR